MADVAAHAGVSLKTVSRVINGEPRVATATAAAVVAAVRELGFRSNHAAASLASGRGVASIGLLIGAVDDPFYARLTSGVEQVARGHRHTVLVSSSEEDPQLERDATLGLAGRQVDGVVVVPCSPDQGYLAADIAAGLAVVFVDRPPLGLDADCVLSDNRSGAQVGTAQLLGRGHRRIAFVGNDASVYTSAERLAGFETAHAQAGAPVDPSLIVLGPRTIAEAEATARALLARPDPPQAIFAQNGLLTMGVWRAVHARGDRVDLVGFDDFALADVLAPPVDVVAQDPVELGRQAAILLFERLAVRDRPVRRVILPTHLVTRS
jgi:LacI family transcriptional regulator